MFRTNSERTKYDSKSTSNEVITTNYIVQEIEKNKKQLLTEIRLSKNDTFRKLHDELFRMIMIKVDELIIEQVKIEIDKFYSENSELNDTLRKSMVENDNTLISMINRLRVEIFENAGLCVIV